MFFITSAFAQTPQPDVGKVLEEIKQIPDLRIPPTHPPSIEVPQPDAPSPRDPSTRRIPIKSFKIRGNTIYPEEVLLALVKRYEGTKLTLAEIRDLTELITQHYRGDGYLLTRVYLPPQEISEGMIEMVVLEGKIGEVRLQPQDKIRLSKSTAARFLSILKKGKVLNERDIERGLLLLNDLPQVEAKATLVAGETVGTTDIIVEINQARLVTASIDTDNYGSRFTGRNRFGAAINLNDLSGLGDLLTFRITTTGSGLNYGRISYTIPFNGHGSRVGLAYSDVNYELGESFASLNATGNARITNFFLSHPFVRSRGLNINARMGLDNKLLRDEVEATNSITDKTANLINLGISIDARDNFAGGGINTFGVDYFHGKLNIKTPDARAADETAHRTQGNFGKATFNFSRLQYLSRRWSFYLSASGQLASKNLDSSEKFGLGGAYSVRAYPQGEVSGDEGYLISGELRWDVLSSKWADFSIAGFLDTGKVKINHNPLPTDSNNTRVLSGAGIGLTWSKPNNYSVRLGYAHKLNRKETDSDNDKGRLLFQAYKLF